MRTLILCLFLAGCSAGIQPAPIDASSPDAEAGDAAIPCPATAEECATILFCPTLCHYDDAGLEEDLGQDAGVDSGPGEDAGEDSGPPADVDAGCNPGVHTATCMNPTSCFDGVHCRPCCDLLDGGA